MFNYHIIIGLRPDNFDTEVFPLEQDGWELWHLTHRTVMTEGGPMSRPRAEPRWDAVLRKRSKEVSYGQMLINRYHAKLEEVSERVRTAGLTAIADDIKQFLFEGSPEDM